MASNDVGAFGGCRLEKVGEFPHSAFDGVFPLLAYKLWPVCGVTQSPALLSLLGSSRSGSDFFYHERAIPEILPNWDHKPRRCLLSVSAAGAALGSAKASAKGLESLEAAGAESNAKRSAGVAEFVSPASAKGFEVVNGSVDSTKGLGEEEGGCVGWMVSSKGLGEEVKGCVGSVASSKGLGEEARGCVGSVVKGPVVNEEEEAKGSKKVEAGFTPT